MIEFAPNHQLHYMPWQINLLQFVQSSLDQQAVRPFAVLFAVYSVFLQGTTPYKKGFSKKNSGIPLVVAQSTAERVRLFT